MKVLITGEKGFIGSALSKELKREGHEVVSFWDSDREDIEHEHFDYFFHFGSPSSTILYNERLDECISETIEDFIEVTRFCRRKHIKLIYPSSATVYENVTPYSHTKSALEQIQQAYNIPSLALRIFAGYGPGEKHKKDYASVLYQFVQQARRDEEIVIFGDGSQSRDFIYIDDIVRTILGNLETEGFLDIGTGVDTTFNEVVEIISKKLGKKVRVRHIDKPKNYVKQTKCNSPIGKFVTVEEGIEKIIHET